MAVNRELIGIAIERISALIGFSATIFILVVGYISAWEIYTSPWGSMTVNVPLTPMILPAIIIVIGKSTVCGIFLMWAWMDSESKWKEYKDEH
jgi:hypothetical protein